VSSIDEVFESGFDGDNIVAVWATFDVGDSGSHQTLDDDCSGSVERDRIGDGSPESVEVFSLHDTDFKAMAGEGLLKVITFQVLRRMASDGDVIVIEEQLDVEILRDGESGSFGIVTLLLTAIRSQTEYGLVTVCECDTVDERPHVAESSRGELDTWGQAKLRMAR
jgi:hypothetical protein